MSRLLRIFGFGILISSLVAVIWIGESAVSDQSLAGDEGSLYVGIKPNKSISAPPHEPPPPPWFHQGDCIGEIPVGTDDVGSNRCRLTCPVIGPLDPGYCEYSGRDYEVRWEMRENWENYDWTWGDEIPFHYLDADCRYIIFDGCYFECPAEVEIEMWNDVWYRPIYRDPLCP